MGYDAATNLTWNRKREKKMEENNQERPTVRGQIPTEMPALSAQPADTGDTTAGIASNNTRNSRIHS